MAPIDKETQHAAADPQKSALTGRRRDVLAAEKGDSDIAQRRAG